MKLMKDISEYVEEYLDQNVTAAVKEAFNELKLESKDLSMANKLGLLWHMVNDRESVKDNEDVTHTLAGLLYILVGKTPPKEIRNQYVAGQIYDMLPKDFRESFKNKSSI